MAVVNELVTKFVFKGNLKPIKDFRENLKGTIVSLTKYTAALGATTTVTIAWANATLRGSESLVRLAQDTQLSIRELQQLQFITAQNGVTADTFADNILNLTEKIGEASIQGSDDFNRLGISVRDANGNIKNTSLVLQEINGRFRALSSAERISFARKLGIDQKLISSFNKTDKELQNLIKQSEQFGLITESQTKQLDSYFASVETLQFGLTALSRQTALLFAPTLEALSKNILEFLVEFNKTYKSVFVEFFDGIGNLVGAFNDLIKNTIGWKVALTALGLAAVVAFPATLIVGAVTLVLAVIEDLITAFKGGESVIKNIAIFTRDLVGSIIKDFKFLDDWITTITNKFKNLLDFIKNTSIQLKTLLGFNGDDATLQVNPISNLQPLTNTTNAINNTTTSNPITITNEILVNVQGGENPLNTGNVIGQSLARELEQANFQFGKGGS